MTSDFGGDRSQATDHSLPGRVLSLDQFRGYTVLGMILVNFIGYFECVHPVFKHNDNYFSYADSIMPAFHLAVGFSFRFTMLHRLALATMSIWGIWWSYLKRSLILVFLGVLLYGIGGDFRTWDQFSKMPAPESELVDGQPTAESNVAAPDRPFSQTFAAQWKRWLAETLKSRMWNTLAIIGVTQIVILPFVATSFRTRVLAMIGFGLGHAFLTYWFNWGFVIGDPENWMVKWWGTGTESSWDGGFFGPLSWAVVMLAGTLAHDVVIANSPRTAAGKLLIVGSAMMLLAWCLSCMSTLYEVGKVGVESKNQPDHAMDPVFPVFTGQSRSSFQDYLAEPPFVQPSSSPESPVRLRNYWMMIKQIPTMTFMMCATGFALLVYGAFVGACDVWGWRLGVLNTFGTNALIAYILHSEICDQINKVVPSDAPLWYVMLGFAAFLVITWAFVRYLENRKIYIRL